MPHSSSSAAAGPPPSASPAGRRLRFFNTQEPVSPLYRGLLPRLAEAGHQVEAVLSRQPYRADQQPWDDRSVRLRRLPTAAPAALPWRLSRLWTHGTYATLAALGSLAWPGVDRNVFLTQPPLFSVWGRVLRALRRQPYCCVLMDLYPWVMLEAGVLAADGLPAAVLRRLALAGLRRAEAVVVIGRCMRDRVAALGIATERIHLARNWADPEQVRPLAPETNPLRRELGLADRFVVMYSGNLGVSHYFDDLMAVAERLQQHPEIAFLIAGDGARRGEIEKAVAQRRLGNVMLTGYQDAARLGESLSVGDVHFVSLRQGFEGLVVPSKAYGILAAGRPTIYQGAREGEIARMVDEEGIGSVVRQGDVDGLQGALLRAWREPAWRRQAGTRARALSEGRYGMQRALDDWTAALVGPPAARQANEAGEAEE
jgi:glycosyltransferase involved in cell wall biosynthesis